MARTTAPPKTQTPYGGMINGGKAATGPHLLVSGPTGVGKTRRVLAPGLVMWQGPTVGVSSKSDLMSLTVSLRSAVGPCYLLDLTGQVRDLPPGVTRVTADPTALVTDDDTALDMASLLLETGHLGAGEGSSDAAVWHTLATSPLATLLLAGAGDGSGMEWVLNALGRQDPASKDDRSPSWMEAARRTVEHSRHARDLEALHRLDSRVRDSVAATMKVGLGPWLRSTVRDGGEGSIPFSPSLLRDNATLYIIAPANGVAAGAAVAAVDSIVQWWRLHHETLNPIQIVIDELANTCPLPSLPTYVTEARGLGVAIVAAVQATSQLLLRWGAHGTEVLRDVFPSVLVQLGAPERELLEDAAWWGGETERWTRSYTEGEGRGNRSTRSAQKQQTFSAPDLLPRSWEEGRLLRGGQPGERVNLPDISEFK